MQQETNIYQKYASEFNTIGAYKRSDSEKEEKPSEMIQYLGFMA